MSTRPTPDPIDQLIANALAGKEARLVLPRGASQDTVDYARDNLQRAALRQPEPIEIVTVFKDGVVNLVVRRFK